MAVRKRQPPWNKGLTKETDPRIKRAAEKQSKTRKERHKSGDIIQEVLQ